VNKLLMIALATTASMLTLPGFAEGTKKYGPGVSDTEIKIGQTMPYSGSASALSMTGKISSAYFKMINAQGGVNGRKINLISVDDGFSPAKTVEQTRKLVEGDEVLAIFSSMGSAPTLAVARYLNNARVPQILSQAGTPKVVDPVNLPWTTIFTPTLTVEAKTLAAYILKAKPDAKVGILYQNDDSGKALADGMKAGLGDKAGAMVIKEVPFDLTFPTIDSQILLLQAAGADTIFFATVASKFAAQGIRKIGELGWKPMIVLGRAVATIESTLKPAGVDHAIGAITTMFQKEPSDPEWENDPGMMDYKAFMKQWAPGEPANEALAMLGYMSGAMMVELLKRCGDDLTRENLMYQATHIKDLQLPLFITGVKVNMTPKGRVPWKQARIARFDGTGWVFVSDIVTAPGED
jgi:branched-chain amino acid transport system substrate-binding protein